MESKDRCELCVHWESRPELEMATGVGYCDYHEKSYKASHWCQFFLARSSQEGEQYKRGMYGGGEDEEENEETDM